MLLDGVVNESAIVNFFLFARVVVYNQKYSSYCYSIMNEQSTGHVQVRIWHLTCIVHF